MTDDFKPSDLELFTNAMIQYKHHLLKQFTYTIGVKYMAEKAGAYWVIGEIISAQLDRHVSAEQFQVWTLNVDNQQAAILVCEDGNNNQIYEKLIEYTDFPMSEIKLYSSNRTIMLPSEY